MCFGFNSAEKVVELDFALKPPDSLIIKDLRQNLVENFDARFFENIFRMNDITFLVTHDLTLFFFLEKLGELKNGLLNVDLEVLMEVLAKNDLFRQQIHDSIKFVLIFNDVFFILYKIKPVHCMKELHKSVFEVDGNLDVWYCSFIINRLRAFFNPF